MFFRNSYGKLKQELLKLDNLYEMWIMNGIFNKNMFDIL